MPSPIPVVKAEWTRITDFIVDFRCPNCGEEYDQTILTNEFDADRGFDFIRDIKCCVCHKEFHVHIPAVEN